jgi:hypothetical protein
MNSYRNIILKCLEQNLIQARWDGDTLLIDEELGADTVFKVLRSNQNIASIPAVLEVPASELIH